MHGGRTSSAESSLPSILITTLASEGGVHAVAEWAAALLHARGHRVGRAFYAPYRRSPELSVPSWRFARARPAVRTSRDERDQAQHEVGVFLPELEWARHRPGRTWRETVARYDLHLTISGSVLPAAAALGCGRPVLAWIAGGFDEDRRARRDRFHWSRRLLDVLVDAPLCRREEGRLLRSVMTLGISHHSCAHLLKLAPGASVHRLPIPIDTQFFTPDPKAQTTKRQRLGFCGRINDPRKRIALALEALRLLRARGHDVELLLAGDTPDARLRAAIAAEGLQEVVVLPGRVGRNALREIYRSLDVFLLSSDQEGLCIAALEAMACGVPVVSTRCGGPEEFVCDGKTGYLAAPRAGALAAAVGKLICDPDQRAQMGQNARRVAVEGYAAGRVTEIFLAHLEDHAERCGYPIPRRAA